MSGIVSATFTGPRYVGSQSKMPLDQKVEKARTGGLAHPPRDCFGVPWLIASLAAMELGPRRWLPPKVFDLNPGPARWLPPPLCPGP